MVMARWGVVAVVGCVALAGCQSAPPRASDAGERRPPARGAMRAFDEALTRFVALQARATTKAQWDAGLREVQDFVHMAQTNDSASPLFLTVLADLELAMSTPDLGRAEEWYAQSLQNARNWPAGYLGQARCARLRGDAVVAREALARCEAALRYLDEGGGGQDDVRPVGTLERTPRERRELMQDLLARRDLWEADRSLSQGPQAERAMRRIKSDIELERLLLQSPEPTSAEYDAVLAWDPEYGDVIVRKAVAAYNAKDYSAARDLLLPIVGDPSHRMAARPDARFICGASLTAIYLESGQPRDAQAGAALLDGLVQTHPWHRDALVMAITLRAGVALQTKDASVAARALRDVDRLDAMLRAPIEGFTPAVDDREFVQQVREALEQVR